MIAFVVIAILLIPVYLQIKYGVKSAAGWLGISHFLLTCLCLLLEIAFAAVLFFLLMYLDPDVGKRCGVGWAGLVIFAIPVLFIIFILAVFQRIVVKKTEFTLR